MGNFDKYIRQFEKGVRIDSGESFWKLVDDRDEKLENLLFEIHKAVGFGTLVFPSDWVYDVTLEAFQNLSEYSDWDDMITEVEPDYYYCDQMKWISENGFAPNWVDEAKELIGHSNFYKEIMQGQCLCKQAIYREVVDFANREIVESLQTEYNV